MIRELDITSSSNGTGYSNGAIPVINPINPEFESFEGSLFHTNSVSYAEWKEQRVQRQAQRDYRNDCEQNS